MNVRVVKNVMNEKNVKNENNDMNEKNVKNDNYDRNVTNVQNVKNVNHAPSLKLKEAPPELSASASPCKEGGDLLSRIAVQYHRRARA